MAYSNTIKEEAFGLYCTEISFDEIANELKQRFPDQCARITRQTIAKWEKKYNWQARRDVILRRTQEKLDAKRISKRAELIAELELLQERILNQTRHLHAKSLEGAVNSALGLTKLILELRGERGKLAGKLDGRELEKVIQIIFDVLAEDPKIGKLLTERQDYILKKIQERIEAQQ